LKQPRFSIGGAFISIFERSLTHQKYNLSIGTAAWAAAVSSVFRSALLGQSLTWRQPRPAGFQLILLRVRRSLVLQPSGGGCSTSVLTDTLL